MAWLVQVNGNRRRVRNRSLLDLVTKQASVDVDLLPASGGGDPFTVTGLPSTAPATDVTLFERIGHVDDDGVAPINASQ